ncbi:MAG: hypothetical protein AUF64_05005 [Chloroflexi bacterium 13_1_20CM_54_36]|jgi:HNH endonuclease|nr:MAG: hypothetical protein AUH05_02515 [Ktedonobacter sp. 13_2_20CM_53_11]OLB53055.1 MAG: hypothetical protein AUI01_12635 [Ktedonobacter sp. 13_2_20CM_2_56_8]OLD83319.1 MAG: hypothetical protein AUF64_05005 [Chloroflexi bacterium 13_1_20CM_54_36]OLE34047.1 MAG: hypothetical protein AUG45_05560 [Ktedonobacter sp. 13_1_20CM_3_54_15]
MAKILRASVMRKSEWDKERDAEAWKRTRLQVLKRDNSTCVYCGWTAQRFMQVNHIEAEDNHDLDNLETVCTACHAVLHIGIKSMQGIISAFDSKPELTNMTKIVYATRVLVARKTSWAEIERQVLQHYALPDGRVYTCEETTGLANQMLKTIQPRDYRGYLPEGTAILFHQSPPWNGFPEMIHMWQLPG